MYSIETVTRLHGVTTAVQQDLPWLVQAESSAAKAAGQDVPKAYIFNTFFWTRLACFGKAVDYAGSFLYLGSC